MLTGTGTKDDPFVITANYYYKNGSLTKSQISSLKNAVKSYNTLGGKNGTKIQNEDGSDSYLKFNLSAHGVEDVGTAITNNIFTNFDDADISYGNAVGTNPIDGQDEFGSANGWGIHINPANIQSAVSNEGYDENKLIKGTFIHEIGHNLGLDHHHNTQIMKEQGIFEINSNIINNQNKTITYSNVIRKEQN